MTRANPTPLATDQKQRLVADAANPADQYLTRDHPANIDPQTQMRRRHSVDILDGVLFQAKGIAGKGSFCGEVPIFEEAKPDDPQKPKRTVVKRPKDYKGKKAVDNKALGDPALQAANEVNICRIMYPELVRYIRFRQLPQTWRSTLPYFPGKSLVYELVNLGQCYSETKDKIFLNRIFYWYFLMLQEMLRLKKNKVVHQDANSGNFIAVAGEKENVLYSIDYGLSRIEGKMGVWDLPKKLRQNMPFLAPELKEAKLVVADFAQDVYTSALVIYRNPMVEGHKQLNWAPYISKFLEDLSLKRPDLLNVLKMALDQDPECPIVDAGAEPDPKKRPLMEVLYACLAYEFILMDEELGDQAQSLPHKKKWYERALINLQKTWETLADMQELWQKQPFSFELIQKKCAEFKTKAAELAAKLVALSAADLKDEKKSSVVAARKPNAKLRNIIPKLILNANEPGRDEIFAYVPPVQAAPVKAAAAARPHGVGEVKKAAAIAPPKPKTVEYYIQKIAPIITKDAGYQDYDAFCGNGPSLELDEFHETLGIAQYRGDYATYQHVVLTHYASEKISCETAYRLMQLVPPNRREQSLSQRSGFDLASLRKKFFNATAEQVNAFYRNGNISYQAAREWMVRYEMKPAPLTPMQIQGLLQKKKVSLAYSIQLLNEIKRHADLASAYGFYQQTVVQQFNAKKIGYAQTCALMRSVPVDFRLKDSSLNKFFHLDKQGIQQRYQQGEISLDESLSALELMNSSRDVKAVGGDVKQNDKKVDATILKDALVQYEQKKGGFRKYLGWIIGVSKTKTIKDLEVLLTWSNGTAISANLFEFILGLSDVRQPYTRKTSVYQNSRVQLFRHVGDPNNHPQELSATEEAIASIGQRAAAAA
jgi:hypothetical protein